MKKILMKLGAVALSAGLLGWFSPFGVGAAAPTFDATGSFVVGFEYLGTDYPHDMSLTQDGGGSLTGGGGYPAGGPHSYEWVIDSGSVSGNTIHLETHYTLGAVCSMTIDGTIAPAGSMSGTWSDDCSGFRSGTWMTTSGLAKSYLIVDDDGVECPGAAYTSIQAAVNAASSGETVQVCAGTYVENQIIIDKALTVSGAGAGITVIDGGSSVTLSNVGLVRITASGNVTFNGFTLKNVGVDPAHTSGGFPVRVGIYAQSPIGGVTYSITNNIIEGTNNPLDEQDYGFYSNSGLENLVFQGNAISKTGANPILLERHYGATDVSNNTWDRGVGDGSVDGYFNMNYGGTNIATLQKVHGNTIGMDSDIGPYDNDHRSFGITFAGDFTSAGTDGGFSNIEVTDNTIKNLKAFRRGIGFWNNGPGSGASGNFTGVTISGNSIKGDGSIPPTGSQGIRILGLATDVNVTKNTISNVDVSYKGQSWNGHIASGTAVNRNSFSDNSTGLVWEGPLSLDATCNWWGHLSGPGPVGPGTGDGVSANVTFTSWLTTSDLSGPCNGPLLPVTVTIVKYIDGQHANASSAVNKAFLMQASWSAENIGSGSGSYNLSPVGFNNPNPYEATTASMTSGADYATSEDLSTPEVGATCDEGKPFVLLGYTVGDTLAEAESGIVALTPLALSGITANKFIIVWNKACPAPLPAGACDAPLPFGWTLVNGIPGDDDVELAPYSKFIGNGGHDKIKAPNVGDYIVCTNSGNDTITLASGSFWIEAGNGVNTVTTASGPGTITTGNGNDNITTGAGKHTIKAGDGNNTITTGSGNDTITTGIGRDVINAGNGNNVVNSGSGNDIVISGSGNDKLNGGPGRDICLAGGGNNTVNNCP